MPKGGGVPKGFSLVKRKLGGVPKGFMKRKVGGIPKGFAKAGFPHKDNKFNIIL